MARDTDPRHELEEVNRRLRLVIDAAMNAFVGMDRDGRITDWNPAAEAMFGWTAAEAIGRSLAETIIPPQYREAHGAGLSRFLATGEGPILNERVEISALRRDGAEFPVELGVRAVDVGDGALNFQAFIHDITDRRGLENALRDSEARHRRLAAQLAAAQQIAAIGSWEWDIVADRVDWSEELFRLFGVDPAEFVATYQGYLECVHPDDRAEVDATIQAAFASGEPFDIDHQVLRPDGTVGWVHSRGHTERDAAGVPVRMSGTAADITDRIAMQDELSALALVDPLTGLHNRRGFALLGDQLLKVASRGGRCPRVVFIDMDDMKTINDTHGHDAGDRALVDVANFLRATLRESDLVARVGGDEFCALLVDEGSPDADLDRLVGELRAGPPMHGRAYPLVLSVGVTGQESGAELSIESLMERADRAMYEDKRAVRRLARVLVVEDDEVVAGMLEAHLGSRFDVVVVSTGAAAAEHVGKSVPDLVLLDLTLPDLPGADVLRQMRGLPGGEHMPVIVITAATQRATELASLQEGVDDFVGKPLDLEILEERMRIVLARATKRPRQRRA